MEKTKIISNFILGLFIALGLSIAGYCIGEGFVNSKIIGRFVSVKGLSERVVQADFANWGMSVVSAGATLESAVEKLENDKAKLLAYLTKSGFAESEIEYDRVRLEDSFAYLQSSSLSEQMINSRYKISQVVVVRTKDVIKVHAAYQKLTELLKEGVMIDSTNQYYTNGPVYSLYSFNDIKGVMLKEAVCKARKSAEVFAADVGSKIGKIKYANQGVFTIGALEGNDMQNEPGSIRKKIRALVTQEYYLED